MRMTVVIKDGVILNVGEWQYDKEDGLENAFPEGAVQGEYEVSVTAGGTYVLSADYEALRAAEYPPMQDQLDALYHAGAFGPEMTAILKAVKDKYPKPA